MQERSVFRSIVRIAVGTSAMLVIVAGLLAAQAFVPIPPAVEDGQEISVTGEIVGVFCYMRADFHGLGHKTCSTKCAEGGSPIAILDEANGELYTLAGASDYQGGHEGRDELIGKLNETVTVTGTLVKKDNSQTIFVENMDGGSAPPIPGE
jgi:hypothetical protein